MGARRWLCELRPGVEKPAAVGLSRLPDVFVRMFFEGMPLTTRFVGMVETAVTGGVCEVVVLPVCGLGLFSLESFPSLPPRALSRRLGVERLSTLLGSLCRRVESKSQCVRFFQCEINPCEGFLRSLLDPPSVPRLSSASLAVTRCSVEPRDRALRSTPGTPSLGGGRGLRRELLTDRIESLSMGGGGSSWSGLNVMLDRPASGNPGRSVI